MAMNITRSVLRYATRHMRNEDKNEKTLDDVDLKKVIYACSVREFLDALKINCKFVPKARDLDLEAFIRLDKKELMDLGFDKHAASKIKRVLFRLKDDFDKQKNQNEELPTHHEGYVESDELSVFWRKFNDLPMPLPLSSPIYLDLPMALLTENSRAVDHILREQMEPKDKAKIVNLSHRYRWTPLMCACVIVNDKVAMKSMNGRYQKIREFPLITKLLNAGADVMKQNTKGETALMLAAEYGHHEVVNLLIEWCDEKTFKAYVNMRDNEGRTALHHATSYQQLPCIRVLLEYAADPNAKDANGMTPLMIAAGGEDEIPCEMALNALLSYGADPTLMNKEGLTAIDMIKSMSVSAEKTMKDLAKARQNGPLNSFK